MNTEVYEKIIHIIRSSRGSRIYPYRECDRILKEEFPSISDYTLQSIYSLEYMRKMKRNHMRVSKIGEELYNRYCEAIKTNQPKGVLLRMSDQVDLSPALVARLIMEQHYEKNPKECDVAVSKTTLTKMMKDSTLITNPDLAYEVYLCILHDDQYGPIADCIKHSIGQEYEMRLRRVARTAGLAFCSEEELRLRGFDKTPDVKLDVPVAVDGFVVNWIESKALFGDEEAHRGYLRDQYLCYWNRFGPGLVIYWFGFVDTLHKHSDNKLIISHDFPENITLMNPALIKPKLTQQ